MRTKEEIILNMCHSFAPDMLEKHYSSDSGIIASQHHTIIGLMTRVFEEAILPNLSTNQSD